MPESAPPIRIVLTTTANPDEAARLGRTLVEERLAACATLIPAVQSIYHWQGQVESSSETLLLLKTGPDQLAALETRPTNCIATRPPNSWSSASMPQAGPTSTGSKPACASPDARNPQPVGLVFLA